MPKTMTRRCAPAALLAALSFLPLTASARIAPELGAWSETVWKAAQAHEGGDALELLFSPPAAVADAGVVGLNTRLEEAKKNAVAWEEKRIARLDELHTKLSEEGVELTEALRHANEMLELEPTRDAVLNDPHVIGLVTRAEAAAAKAEEDHRWLEALELYSRLSLLFEVEGTYEEDVLRNAQRLQMLRLYTPQLLHEMQSAQRVAEGEEPLPPFNPLGEDWQVKLADISEEMVVHPIARADISQVDDVALSEMMLSGFRAVRTMASTDDLSRVFPGLADAADRAEFFEFLDASITQISEAPNRETQKKAVERIEALLSVGEHTVGLAPEVLLHEFGNGAMGALDEYSTIVWPDELKQFKRSIEGKFTGVGIQITLNDSKVLEVVTPLQGTPAARAGVRSGDRIVSVNGSPTLGFTLNQAVDRITGPEGTAVELEVERDGHDGPIKISLVRAEIPIHSVKGWERTGPGEMDWDWMIDGDNKIGYIRLVQFSNETTGDLHQAINELKLQGAKGLILDLRYNPGGLLDEAVSVANTFMATDQVVVFQEDGQGFVKEEQRARKSAAIYPTQPLVVLINEGSASASEIVAGCLQDYGRAILVGETSFGKGSVQNVFPLDNERAMFKLTTQYYRLPGGRLIHRRPQQVNHGVEPDVAVNMLPDQVLESLKLRNEADVMVVDAAGNPDPTAERPDPEKLLTEGYDPQLATALLLLQSKVGVERHLQAASAR